MHVLINIILVLFQVGQVHLANKTNAIESTALLNNLVEESSEAIKYPKLVRRARILDSGSESDCVSMHAWLYTNTLH